MSRSAQVNSRKEVMRGASREELARNDARKSAARRESQENIIRSKTRRRKARIKSGTIRARRQALRRLSDEELLSGLDMLHGDERVALLDILLYFSELERRRLYVPMGYGSLFEFCVDTYRYSRSTAWRRVSAARCIERFPEVAEMFLAGELNLCALSMISGILTRENAGEVLAWVRGRPIKDVELLVARYRPEKIIRDRIKPVFVMNPGTGSGAGAGYIPGTGGGGAGSISPLSTTLGCANSPSEGDNTNASFNIETECTVHRTSTPDVGSGTFPKSKIKFTVMPGGGSIVSGPGAGNAGGVPDPGNTGNVPGTGNDSPGSPAAAEPERVVVTKKYKISFAVEPEFMKKLHKIKTLLSPKFPKGMGFEQVIDILMNEYLELHSLESRMKKREQRRAKKKGQEIAKGKTARNDKTAGDDNYVECGDHGEVGKKTRKRRGAQPGGAKTGHTGRTRQIPQAVRDQVFVRDGGRCTFISKNGKRCEEIWNLEIDHTIPYAKGGDNSPENLRLLCATHNRLEAEKTYGTDHMKKFYRRE